MEEALTFAGWRATTTPAAAVPMSEMNGSFGTKLYSMVTTSDPTIVSFRQGRLVRPRKHSYFKRLTLAHATLSPHTAQTELLSR